MFVSLMPAQTPTRQVKDPVPSRFERTEWGRHAVIAWAFLYTYLLVVAPAPDPEAVVTLAQEIMGWVLMGAILSVFVTSMAGRRLVGATLAASAIGGGVLAYNGIDCIMAGHTESMFYVMTVGGLALTAHALYAARTRLAG